MYENMYIEPQGDGFEIDSKDLKWVANLSQQERFKNALGLTDKGKEETGKVILEPLQKRVLDELLKSL